MFIPSLFFVIFLRLCHAVPQAATWRMESDITILSTFSMVVPVGYTLTLTRGSFHVMDRDYNEKPLFDVRWSDSAWFSPLAARALMALAAHYAPLSLAHLSFQVYGTLVLGQITFTSAADTGVLVKVHTGGVLTSSLSTFIGCHARVDGGVIWNAGTVTVTGGVFSGSNATRHGGAIANAAGGVVTVSTTTFTDSEAQFGGAISAVDATTTVMTTTFSGSSASAKGGDMYQDGGVASLATSSSGNAYSGGVGGSVAIEGSGQAAFTTVVVSGATGRTAGGAVWASEDAAVVVAGLSISDANLYDRASSLGGGVFLGDRTALTGSGLSLANTLAGSLALGEDERGVRQAPCRGGTGKGCQRSVWRGGGVYAEASAAVELTGLSCDAMHAHGSGSCLFATGSARVALTGGSVNSTANTTRAVGLYELAQTANFSGITFFRNRRGALHLLAASADVSGCTFLGDMANAPAGRGGSVWLEKGSTLTGSGVVAEDCHADNDGGWLWAEASSVRLRAPSFTNMFAGSKGGVIYADSMFEVVLASPTFTGNDAREGGAVYARACGYPDRFQDHSLYRGVQITDGTFTGNRARIGGALNGEFSSLYVARSTFTDNTNKGLGARGSAVVWTPDAIFEACALVSNAVTVEEDGSNVTMIEAQRLVLDDSTLSMAAGVAIKLVNATEGWGAPGAPFTLLSRNTDLSGLRIVGDPNKNDGRSRPGALSEVGPDDSWGWVGCSNDPLTGAATGKYALDSSVGSRSLPRLQSERGLTYAPVCPADATCADDALAMTIRCTCPAGSAFPSVNNFLARCQTLVPTHTPTQVPTEMQVQTPMPTGGVKVRLTNYTVHANDILSIDVMAILDLPPACLYSFYTLSALVAAVVLASLALNVTHFKGMPDAEYQRWALFLMYMFPDNFHVMLCVDREAAVEQLTSAGELEEKREAKRLRKAELKAQGRTMSTTMNSEAPEEKFSPEDRLQDNDEGPASLKFRSRGGGPNRGKEETKDGEIELRALAAVPGGRPGKLGRSMSGMSGVSGGDAAML